MARSPRPQGKLWPRDARGDLDVRDVRGDFTVFARGRQLWVSDPCCHKVHLLSLAHADHHAEHANFGFEAELTEARRSTPTDPLLF